MKFYDLYYDQSVIVINQINNIMIDHLRKLIDKLKKI